MSKRKISKQQRFRIQKIQQLRLNRAQKVLEQTNGDADASELGPEQSGLLIAHHGKYVDVESLDGKLYRCNLRQHLGTLIAGDNVIWRPGKKMTGVVVALSERQSLLWRPDDRGERKPIAANIDQIIVVIAPQPKPVMSLIDSYLVATAYFGINTIILLNKIDLLPANEKSELQKLLMIYGNIGYQVILSSTKKLRALSQLKTVLENHVSILVGQSGVGKSSLIHRLIPNVTIAIGELSVQSEHGVHTTTTSQLYHLPSGGDLIDSPGIREFGLWHLKPEEVAPCFVEFAPYLGQCKFRNCLHRNEPGCAILAAFADGHISAHRLASYHDIIDKLL